MRHVTLTVLAASTLMVAPVLAQQPAGEALPAARALVAKYVTAIGGEAVLKRHQSRHAKGRIEVPAQGIGGTIEVYSAAPNKLFVRTDIPGMGLIRAGFNGDVAWTVHPAMGPMVLDGRMRDQMRQQADVLAPLHGEAYVKSVETVGKTVFEGRPSYKIKVVTQWGEEYHEFFDADTGLLLGYIRHQATPMGDIETTTVLSDYRDMDGLQVPMKSVQRMMGMEQVLTVSTLQLEAVDPSVFTLPAEIQALVVR